LVLTVPASKKAMFISSPPPGAGSTIGRRMANGTIPASSSPKAGRGIASWSHCGSWPSSIAIRLPNSTVIATLSPGITISVPSGNMIVPVTSVVRKKNCGR